MPFVYYTDGEGVQQIVTLPVTGRASIGRDPANDISLSWDERVSRLHAELEFLGGAWTVADDGLSRNGTFLNGTRVRGRRRLEPGDRLTVGATAIAFSSPESGDHGATHVAPESEPPRLTDAQRRVLLALCRPYGGGGFATPATNKDIADELFLSIDAVKTHLRGISERLGVAGLPQNVKRTRLVERAFELGLVTQRDLEG